MGVKILTLAQIAPVAEKLAEVEAVKTLTKLEQLWLFLGVTTTILIFLAISMVCCELKDEQS